MRSGGCPCTPEWSCSSPSGTSPFPTSNVGEKPTVILYTYINRHAGTPEKKRKEKKRKEKKRKEKKRKEKKRKEKKRCCLKKNLNAPRPSEHPPVRGKKMSKRLGGINS